MPEMKPHECPFIGEIVKFRECLTNLEEATQRIEGLCERHELRIHNLEIAKAKQNGIAEEKKQHGKNWVAWTALFISAVGTLGMFIKAFLGAAE